MNPHGEGPGYDRVEDLMHEELAALEGCTPPKHRCSGEETGSKAGSLRNTPMIAAMAPRRGQGTSRVPRGRDGGGTPHLRNLQLNPAAPPAPRYLVTVDELTRIIRHAKARHRGWSGSSPSSSGTSHATQQSTRRIIHIARMLLAMLREMALGMDLDKATGGGMVRDIEVGP